MVHFFKANLLFSKTRKFRVSKNPKRCVKGGRERKAKGKDKGETYHQIYHLLLTEKERERETRDDDDQHTHCARVNDDDDVFFFFFVFFSDAPRNVSS